MTTTPIPILSLNILGRVVGLDNDFLNKIAEVLDGLIARPVSAPAATPATPVPSPYAGSTSISSLFTLLKLFTDKINDSSVTEAPAPATAGAETAKKTAPAKPDDSENRERFIKRYKDTFEPDTLGYIFDSCGGDRETMSSRMNHLAALE